MAWNTVEKNIILIEVDEDPWVKLEIPPDDGDPTKTTLDVYGGANSPFGTEKQQISVARGDFTEGCFDFIHFHEKIWNFAQRNTLV